MGIRSKFGKKTNRNNKRDNVYISLDFYTINRSFKIFMYKPDKKHIAKNTLMLYIRMVLVMLVSLFISRVMLNALGVKDYGIYNIVGSVVVAFSFISGPLGTATQRFLSYELGKKNYTKLSRVFTLSLLIYIILAVLLFILIELAGQWFIYNKMQMPAERLTATIWAFHFSVLSFIVSLFKTCFDALIISHEKMSFYAYLSIIEVLLKLLNAFLIIYSTFDKLILFTANLSLISILILSVIIIYCRKKISHVRIKFIWDKKLFKELLGFSGWSLFGSIASMSANQGLNILLNVFYGVVVNAAMGIATQVGSAVNQFVLNFQIAFRPQIVKSYADGNLNYLRELILKTSKFSFLLLFAIACPVFFNINFLLNIWLGNSIPNYTAIFCSFILLYSLLESLSAPLWMTVQATGHIKKYQLIISSVIFLNIILSYISLKLGASPMIVLEIKCCLDIVYLIVRLWFVHNMIQLSYKSFVKKVIFPITTASLSSFLIIKICLYMINCDGWSKLLFSTFFFEFIYVILIWIFSLDKQEKQLSVNTLFRFKRYFLEHRK